MEILFGIVILVLLVAGWRSRKKADKKWVQEERYDESGAWIDKRSGERGTFGSRDEEMENERQNLRKQSRSHELARVILTWFFESYPGFHELSDAQIKAFSAYAKIGAAGLVDRIEASLDGKIPPAADTAAPVNDELADLKKKVMDFAFGNFPRMLELEIEVIEAIDAAAGQLAGSLAEKTGQIRQSG